MILLGAHPFKSTKSDKKSSLTSVQDHDADHSGMLLLALVLIIITSVCCVQIKSL